MHTSTIPVHQTRPMIWVVASKGKATPLRRSGLRSGSEGARTQGFGSHPVGSPGLRRPSTPILVRNPLLPRRVFLDPRHFSTRASTEPHSNHGADETPWVARAVLSDFQQSETLSKGGSMLGSKPQIGSPVSELRRRLKMTQEEFAHAIGVTVSTVNRWENGHIEPSRLARRAMDGLAAQVQAVGFQGFADDLNASEA